MLKFGRPTKNLFKKILILVFLVPYVYCAAKVGLAAYSKTWPHTVCHIDEVRRQNFTNQVHYTYVIDGVRYKSTSRNLNGWIPDDALWDQLKEYDSGQLKKVFYNPHFPFQATLEQNISGVAVLVLMVLSAIFASDLETIKDIFRDIKSVHH